MPQESRTANSEAIKPARLCKCGDNFEDPIPTGSGSNKDSSSDSYDKNHWKVVLDSYLEADKKQCELWKDEVNILLIFAGLFSAVVTAFLIESYKFLLENSSPDPSKFRPDSPHVVRLNSLWFCSLVLSLATVVIGIVALQWIRNHQRYHGIKPRDQLSVYEMRTKALRAWHLRWAFLSLPLLILVALVLFFVGLVDFLLSLNKQVAAPVAVLVYITLAILFITTVLPSAQIFWLWATRRTVEAEDDMPVPCPYKSPQSWIFHRFWIRVIRIGRYIWYKIQGKQVPEVIDVAPADVPLYFTFYSAPTKWTDYDTKWLRLRDMYSQMMEPNFKQNNKTLASVSMEHPRRPIYDEAKILTHAISTVNPSAEVLFAAYHCFQEVSKDAVYNTIECTADAYDPKADVRTSLLRSYYWRHITQGGSPNAKAVGPPISSLIQSPSLQLLHDENMLVFLQMHSAHNVPEEASRVISAHLSELQSRILAYTYTNRDVRIKSPVDAIPSSKLLLTNSVSDSSSNALEEGKIPPSPSNIGALQWLRIMSQQHIDMINSTSTLPTFKIWSQFATSSLNGTEVPVSPSTVEKAIIQYSLILEEFLKGVVDLTDSDWSDSIYAHRSIHLLLDVPATMMRYRGASITPFDPFPYFEGSLKFIQSELSDQSVRHRDNRNSLDEKDNDRSATDYLFLCACYWINQLFKPNMPLSLAPFSPEQCRVMAAMIKALDAYEAHSPPARIQENWEEFWSHTGLPKEPSFDHRPRSERRSYIRWSTIPSWLESHLKAPPALSG